MAKSKSKSSKPNSQENKKLVDALRWARSKQVTKAAAGKRLTSTTVLKGSQLRAARKWLEAYTYGAEVKKIGRGAASIKDERIAGSGNGRIAIIPKAGETIAVTRNKKGPKRISVLSTYRGKTTREVLGISNAAKKGDVYHVPEKRGETEFWLEFDSADAAIKHIKEYAKRSQASEQKRLETIEEWIDRVYTAPSAKGKSND